jgi:hypothetical protein
MEKVKLYIVVIVAVFISGCASIHTYREIKPQVQGTNKASIGGKVFVVNVTENLPNAFGKADIYGGKVNKGKSELVYLGINPDGKLIFNISEIEYATNETTMSRYGQTTAIATTNKNGLTSITNITIQEPPKSYSYPLPENSRTFGFDPQKNKAFSISGVIIEVINYDDNSIIYKLSEDPEYNGL